MTEKKEIKEENLEQVTGGRHNIREPLTSVVNQTNVNGLKNANISGDFSGGITGNTEENK